MQKKNFVPRLITLYYKLLCAYFKYILKRNHFYQHQMLKTSFEICKRVKSAGEMKLMIASTSVCTISLSFEIYFFEFLWIMFLVLFEATIYIISLRP